VGDFLMLDILQENENPWIPLFLGKKRLKTVFLTSSQLLRLIGQ
jgi:hypothetical protein